MAQPKKFQYNICKGPSTFDMVKSLTDSVLKDVRHLWIEADSIYNFEKMESQAIPTLKVEFVVTGMVKEDGSGENWLFAAYCKQSGDHRITSDKIEGFYSAHSRTGYFKFVEKLTIFPDLS